MLKPKKSQKIIMSARNISSLPDSILSKHQLPNLDEDTAYPRVFPSSIMPLKVALARRIKAFE